jgi:hypothetical protein
MITLTQWPSTIRLGKLRVQATIALLSCAALSCSMVTVTRVKPDDYTTKGYRYWLTAPYLLVNATITVSQKDTLWEYDGTRFTPIGQGTGGGARRRSEGEHAQAGHQNAGATAAPAGPAGIPPPPDPTKPPPAAPATPADPAAPKKTDDTATAKPAEPTAAMSIVWLPDYCQQYAINQINQLASSSIQLQFADGSKLTSVNSQLNSTEVINKVIDTVATVAGAVLKGGAPAPSAPSPSPSGAKGDHAQAGGEKPQKRIFRRIETTVIPPGAYAIFTECGCSTAPQFSVEQVRTVTSTTWAEVGPADGGPSGVKGGMPPK